MANFLKSKGPAEAATSPDHGSSHPEKGKQMNMHTNSIEEAALPAPQGKVTVSVDMAQLSQLSMREAKDLWDAVSTVGEVMCGLLCQPRYATNDSNAYNAAGIALETLQEWVSTYEQAIINVALARRPSSASEIENRARLLLQFNAMCGHHLTRLAAFASDAANHEREALAAERRAAQ